MIRSGNRRFHVKAAVACTIVVCFLLALSLPTLLSAASKTEADIRAVLGTVEKTYKNRDIEGVMAMYVNDPSTTHIGAGKEQKAVGYEAVRKAYERDFAFWKENTRLEHKLLSWSSAGKVMWFAIDLSATFITKDGVMDTAGRFTAVMKKKGKKWQFAQTHYSFPIDAAKVVVLEFKQVDTNQDGRLEYKELSVVIKGLTAEQFRKYDANKDGYLSDEEFRAIWGR